MSGWDVFLIMRVIIIFLMIITIVLSFTVNSFSKTVAEERQATRDYLKILDAKLEMAKKANQFAKVNLLHDKKEAILSLTPDKPVTAVVVFRQSPPIEPVPPVAPVASAAVSQPVAIIFYWIVFGLLAGSIANYIAPGMRGGFVGASILGIVGAVVGGYLGQLLFGVGVTGFNLYSLMLAIFGSLIVLFIGSQTRIKEIKI